MAHLDPIMQYDVLCKMHHALCIMHRALCVMHCVLSIRCMMRDGSDSSDAYRLMQHACDQQIVTSSL